MLNVTQTTMGETIGAIRELTIAETEVVSGAILAGRPTGPVRPTGILLPAGYFMLPFGLFHY
jgi:hypothetical protein